MTVISQDGMEESASSRKASSGPPSLSKPVILSRASKKRLSSKARLVENIDLHRFVRGSLLGVFRGFLTLLVEMDGVAMG
jgi:hypothetical protein